MTRRFIGKLLLREPGQVGFRITAREGEERQGRRLAFADLARLKRRLEKEGQDVMLIREEEGEEVYDDEREGR